MEPPPFKFTSPRPPRRNRLVKCALALSLPLSSSLVLPSPPPGCRRAPSLSLDARPTLQISDARDVRATARTTTGTSCRLRISTAEAGAAGPCVARSPALAAASTSSEGGGGTDGGGGGGAAPRTKGAGDNKAMAFLRGKGRVGGASPEQFVNAIGVDEGPSGKSPPAKAGGAAGGLKKARAAYRECTATGIIDDMSESFPATSSGTKWSGVSDRVMGGISDGTITREVVDGRVANVLRGRVSLENNGGFIQMATDLSLDPAYSITVDASDFDGVELDVYHDCPEEGVGGGQSFNVHLRTTACVRQFSSYRATFELERGRAWTSVRLPWKAFVGHGPGADATPLDSSALRRIGVVAIGREMDRVFLALGGVGFYRDDDDVPAGAATGDAAADDDSS